MSRRTPSSSTRHDACPNQVTCTPSVRGACGVLTTGIGWAGRRVSLFSRNRRSTSRWPDGIDDVPREVLWKAPAR